MGCTRSCTPVYVCVMVEQSSTPYSNTGVSDQQSVGSNPVLDTSISTLFIDIFWVNFSLSMNLTHRLFEYIFSRKKELAVANN